MKNISLNINPNAITSLAPPQQFPPGSVAVALKQTHSLSFSIQFESEVECLIFATKLLNMTNGE